ncbi:MAG: hypothetical protein HZB64_01120 [Rhodocyclales bacterium]|nr:hypothetical protein [Rhodocyclales bacterium]
MSKASYRRFILPLVLIGGAVAASVFASFLVARNCNKQKKLQQAALDDWVDEGGNMTASDVAAPLS